MNFHLIRQLGKFNSPLLNYCACRSINSYSSVSLTELKKYAYIDERRIQSDTLETSVRFRDSSSQGVNIPRLRLLLKIHRKQSAYRSQLFQYIKKIDSEINTLLEIMKPPNEDIRRRISLCENRKSFVKRQRDAVNQYYQVLNTLVLNEYMSIPNDLHENTPTIESNVIFQTYKDRSYSPLDHLSIGRKLDVLNYLNSSYYFLMNDAVLLEFATLRHFSNILQENKFQSFLNPDTCNNFVIDGTSDGKTDNFFKLTGDKYSLVGGASFSSFCALRVGQSTHMKYLPERNVTQSRNYTPQKKYRTEDGLYSVFQRSNVNIMIVAESKEQMDEEFQKTLDVLKFSYEQANLDFRISYQPANHLLSGESLRANIELYSIHLKNYVEVAHLSMYGDYVSKRLLMLCHDKNSNYKYVNLIEGVAVSYPTLLAYLLERSNEKELYIPECLQSLMYKKS